MKSKFSEPGLLDTILKTIAALVVIMDSKGNVVLFNEACQALTGYDPDEVEGAPLWELLVPTDERDAVIGVFDDLRTGDFPNQHENDWLTRSGERRRISWSNSAVVGNDGQVDLVVATGIDVTERRKAEKHKRELSNARSARRAAEAARDSLRISEGVFSGIVDLCADAIISVNSEQNITLFNQGAEEVFGYSTGEVLGEPLSILLPPDARVIHSDHIRGFSDSAKASRRMGDRQEIYGLRKNGDLFPADASISKHRVDGDLIFTAVVRDVTNEKEAREQLKRANQELGRSNTELEHFAAAASHDLQEPLRKIQAFGDRLRSRFGDLLPERGQDYLDRMQNAAARMSDLIDDLLAFSRVTTRAKPFVNIELSDVIKDTISDLEMRIDRTQGQVNIGPLPRLDADPLQMRLLFQNLIGNALKFHREGVPPIVEIGIETRPDCDDDRYQIFVQDNGTGFDEKYLDRIFDVFQRLHGRGVYEGTGMGLAIARKVVERHSGTLDATSTPGEGSRFIITLPATQSQHQEKEEADNEQ